MVEVTLERAKEYFDLDPKTGIFYHKPRPREQFASKSAYVQNQKRAGKQAHAVNRSSGYVILRIDKTDHLAHRIAWLMVHGELPTWPKCEIDHINGDRSDNRIENLRRVDRLQNCRNLGKNSRNTSGVTGVFWEGSKNLWRARICVNNVRIYLGMFKNIEDAKAARAEAEEFYGFIGINREPFKSTLAV